MTTNVKVGTLTTNTGLGNQSISGLGFTPKIFILWGTNLTAETTTLGMGLGMGAYDGTNQWGTMWRVDGDSQGADSESTNTTLGEIFIHSSAFTLFRYSAVSLDSDGFTINIDLNTNSVAYLVNWMAIGGDGVEAAVGFADIDLDAVTGLAFQPDLVMTSFIYGDPATDTQHSSVWGMGAAINTADAWAAGWTGGFFGNNTNIGSNLLAGKFINAIYNNAALLSVALDDMQSDGFDWTSTAVEWFGYIALKCDVGIDVGIFQKTTGAAPATQALPDLGFTPQAYMLLSCMETDETTYNGGKKVMLGAFDGTTAWQYAAHKEAAAYNGDSFTDNDGDVITLAGVDASKDSVGAPQAMTSSTPDIIWDPNEAVAYDIAYIAFGENAAPGGGPPINTLSMMGAGV